MTPKKKAAVEQEIGDEYTALQEEANRLLEFKRQNIKKQNQTRCPACATYVHINANKCPHCTSDITAHTALAREELRKLDDITAELYRLQKGEMERREEHSTGRPILERITSFLSDPRIREDAKVVLPSLFLFFVLFLAARKHQDHRASNGEKRAYPRGARTMIARVTPSALTDHTHENK